jgi:hypothetical protein
LFLCVYLFFSHPTHGAWDIVYSCAEKEEDGERKEGFYRPFAAVDAVPCRNQAIALKIPDNTLSVQADDITYDPGEYILEALGNVVTQDESGQRKAPSMTFYVHDGQAILMGQQDC